MGTLRDRVETVSGHRRKIAGAAFAAGLLMTMARPAAAADLGGGCCADLDERVAELEATVARKGTRKVSLEVSGWVNTALMAFDDGGERNAHVVDNAQDRSRARFRGTAKLTGDWSAGFLIEFGLRTARSDRVSASADDTNDGVDVRHASWSIGSKSLGRVTVGQTSQVSDGITQINLGGVNHVARSQVFDLAGGFSIRAGGAATAVRWRDLAVRENPGEGNRQNLVRYDAPALYGFTLSAAWGEDDVTDVGLRYAGDIGDLKLAAGIALARWSESDAGGTTCLDRQGAAAGGSDTSCRALGLSASVLHGPSGLFASVAHGVLIDDARAAAAATFTAAPVEDSDRFLWLEAGLKRSWSAAGKTTFYGEYYRGAFGTPTRGTGGGAFAGRQIGGNDIVSSVVEMWGVGINQSLEKAAMDLYLGVRAYSADIRLENGTGAAAVDDLRTLVAGAVVRF